MASTVLLLGLLAALSPEIEVAPPLYGLNPHNHYGARAAVNGDGQWLIGYQDERYDDSGWVTGPNLRLTRMTPSGTMLAPGGVEPFAEGERVNPDVASDGVDYLVTFTEYDDFGEASLHAMRVAADGSMSSPILIRSATKFVHRTWATCWNGSEYRVVFAADNNDTGEYTLWTARLDALGLLIGAPTAFPVASGSYGYSPALACRADGHSLIGWTEWSQAANGARVAEWQADGSIGATQTANLPSPKRTASLALAASSNKYLAAWSEERGATVGLVLVAQVLSSTGARTATSDLALAGPTGDYAHGVDLAYDGFSFRVATAEKVGNVGQVQLTTISTGGTITAATTTVTDGNPGHGASGLTCTTAQTCLLLYSDSAQLPNYSISTIAATRLGASNTLLDSPPLRPSFPSDEQSQLRMAFDGAAVLVAWLSATGTARPDVYVRRQSPTGEWLDATPRLVATSGYAIQVAALPGGGFAIMHSHPNAQESFRQDVRVSFLSSAGVLTDAAAPLVTKSDYWFDQLFCRADECALFGNGSFDALRAWRFTHAGALLTSTPQPQTPACQPSALVGDVYWCVGTPKSAETGVAVTRLDPTTLAALGAPLVTETIDEKINSGPILAPLPDGVTLIWAASHPNAQGPDMLFVRMKAMRVALDGGSVLDGPKTLFESLNLGWLMPRSLVRLVSGDWLFFYANDGQSVYQLRAQQVTAALATMGAAENLSPAGLELLTSITIATSAEQLLLGYLKRDSAPDRGSHRVKLRTTGDFVIVDEPDLASAFPDGIDLAAPDLTGVAASPDLKKGKDAASKDSDSGSGDDGPDVAPTDDGGTTDPGDDRGGCGCSHDRGRAPSAPWSEWAWLAILTACARAWRARRGPTAAASPAPSPARRSA